MRKIIYEIHNTFCEKHAHYIPRDLKTVLWNTQNFTNEIRKLFPEMSKSIPSSFPDLWYFLHNAIMFWFYKVGMWTQDMAENRE